MDHLGVFLRGLYASPVPLWVLWRGKSGAHLGGSGGCRGDLSSQAPSGAGADGETLWGVAEQVQAAAAGSEGAGSARFPPRGPYRRADRWLVWRTLQKCTCREVKASLLDWEGSWKSKSFSTA